MDIKENNKNIHISPSIAPQFEYNIVGDSNRLPLSPIKRTLNENNTIYELDETTGYLIPKVYNSASTKPINSQLDFDDLNWFQSKHLDEVTGELINVDLSDVTEDGSDDNSDFSQYDDSYKNITLGSTSKELNELTGLVSRKRSRKNASLKDDWQGNINKKARENGNEYYSVEKKTKTTPDGYKLRKARQLEEACDNKKCHSINKKNRCSEIDENTRKLIFNSFWYTQTWEQKKTYVSALVEKDMVKVHTSTKKKQSRRNHTLKYHLIKNNERLQVCKKMFLSTLCLGEWSVINWVSNSDQSGISKIKKKKIIPKSLNVMKVNLLNHFLDAIPRMPSHYCRASSNKKYLELNYRSGKDVFRCYKQFLKDENISENESASYELLIKTMHSRNLGIFKPRKDQCDICIASSNKTVSELIYNMHIENKNRAREEKANDKQKAIDSKMNVLTVDVQAVQLLPYLPAGSLYFKQKLACHQFTLYNLSSGKVLCYVWHEGNGEMTANIFASCVLDFLEHEIEDIKTIPTVIYSDGCPAQNRNVVLSNALIHFAKKHNVTIIQKYLTKGHTQMECDSVHAKIESRKKNREMHSPADYVKIIEEARLENPYRVKYVDYKFFKDFGSFKFLSSIRPGSNKRGQPCVNELKALKYTKDDIMYKISFNDEWKLLPQKLNKNKTFPKQPDSLYTAPLPIPFKKYNDLQSLKNVINRDCHDFYDKIVHLHN